MFSVTDEKMKGVGHKKRNFRKMCDTEDENNAGKNSGELEIPAKKNDRKKKRPAKVSGTKVVQEKRDGKKEREKRQRINESEENNWMIGIEENKHSREWTAEMLWY